MSEKYKHVVFSEGFSIKVTPEDRAVDVMHYLLTGGLLGGKSLEGVTYEEVGDVDHGRLRKKAGDVLRASMRETLQKGNQ